MLVGTGLAVLLAITAAWWLLGRGDRVPATPGATDAPPALDTAPPPPPPGPIVAQPQPIDAASTEIPALLLQADTYKDYGTKQELSRRLTFPPGENAVDLYRRVLTLDPANAAAKRGLADVATFYLDSARGFCDRQLWPVCANLASDGLKAEPDNAELKAVLDKAQAAARGG